MAGGLAVPAAGAAAPHITATPDPIPFGQTLIVKGRRRRASSPAHPFSACGGFWIAPSPGLCMLVSARAFDAEGRPLGEVGGQAGCPAAP